MLLKSITAKLLLVSRETNITPLMTTSCHPVDMVHTYDRKVNVLAESIYMYTDTIYQVSNISILLVQYIREYEIRLIHTT